MHQLRSIRLATSLAGLALLVTAGCAGVRSTAVKPAAGGRPPAAGEVRLVVSRDFGARILKDVLAPVGKDETVLRLLADHCDVDTAYGGGFVNGIDGLRSTFGGASSDDAADWFYWVDGRMGGSGAGDTRLMGGETIWWDYHRWAGAMFIPASLHAFPAPFLGSPLALADNGSARPLAAWAEQNGLQLGVQQRLTQRPAGRALVVATIGEASATTWLRAIVDRGSKAGVFVSVAAGALRALTQAGALGPQLEAAAFAVPGTDDPAEISLVLIARDQSALADLLRGLTPQAASAHVALGLRGERVVPLPTSSE